MVSNCNQQLGGIICAMMAWVPFWIWMYEFIHRDDMSVPFLFVTLRPNKQSMKIQKDTNKTIITWFLGCKTPWSRRSWIITRFPDFPRTKTREQIARETEATTNHHKTLVWQSHECKQNHVHFIQTIFKMLVRQGKEILKNVAWQILKAFHPTSNVGKHMKKLLLFSALPKP